MLLLFLSLFGLCHASYTDFPEFLLTYWAGDSYIWYRNGNQPWWVEEDRRGDWHETWYEEKMDKETRTVYLKDWTRQLSAVVSPTGVKVVSAQTGKKVSEAPGQWAEKRWTSRDNKVVVRTNDMMSFTMEQGGEKRNLVLLKDHSTERVLSLQGIDGFRLDIAEDSVGTTKGADDKAWSPIGRGRWATDRIDEEVIREVEPSEVINPGMPIALVTGNTPNIAEWAVYGEANQKHYAMLHGYTLYIYRRSLLPRKIVTWNKVLIVPRHLNDHEYVMWIDSDAIFTDMDKKIEDVIAKAPEKNFLACGDIGGWMLNTGVMIFKNSDWAKKMLSDLWALEHFGHDKAAEQNQLITMLRKQDSQRNGWHLFDECEFNCHPRHHKEGHYIMHMMGDSGANRMKTFTKWNLRFGVDMKGLKIHPE